MTIDKFGRSRKALGNTHKGLKGEGFNLTPDGDYDMQKKKICNLATPVKAQDAATKHYVDNRSVPYDKERYIMQNKRVGDLADPDEPTDAVNLRTLNKLSMTLSSKNFNARNKQIKNLSQPTEPMDAVSKVYVEKNLDENLLPITTNIAQQNSDINSLKTRLAKCEGLITGNKQDNEKNLRKLAFLIYNYINNNKGSTGRTVAEEAGEKDWKELFKIPGKASDSDDDDGEEEPLPPDPGIGILFPYSTVYNG